MTGILRDPFSAVKPAGSLAIVIADSTGAKSSAAIDTNLARFLGVYWRFVTKGAAGTFDLKLQESDTSGGSYTDVTSAAIVQQTAAGTGSVDWGGLNTKRWVKLVGTAGTNAIDAFAVLLVSQEKTYPNPL